MQRFFTGLAGLAGLSALSAVAGAQGKVVNVVASDYKFEAPDTIAAGAVTFRLTGSGPELHHMQLARLEHGKTFTDFEASLKVQGPPPEWITFLGGPNARIPDGQHPTFVTTTLSAGNYVLVCVMPSSDGTPHIAKGMYRSLTVTAAAGVKQAGDVKADLVLSLYDYNFDFDKPVKAGKHTILIKNGAKQWHEAFLARLPNGAPVSVFPEWVAAGMKGMPPVIPEGGIVALSPGQTNLLTVDLEPGEYALYCFIPDVKDGQEHVKHGMLKKFVVTN